MSSNRISPYEEVRAIAKRRLPRMVFDYIDGSAGIGWGEDLNLAAIANVRLRQRVLVDV
ncbi:MAG: alpha-hydroxy-acid oxidizing protein, partial [Betaproteobacteria bacterium]|nr:alpha-hydroxy-acid oxidizing protein [Betaproteobacteria bacterium]